MSYDLRPRAASEMGGLTPELELVRDIGTAGLLVGGSLGAMLNGRLAIVKFVERNQATPFESQIVAKVGPAPGCSPTQCSDRLILRIRYTRSI